MIKLIGDRLKELREDKQITQSELAEILKVSRQTISSYELNLTEPTFETLVKIADIFGVSTDYLLGRTKDLGFENQEVLFDIATILKNYNIMKKD